MMIFTTEQIKKAEICDICGEECDVLAVNDRGKIKLVPDCMCHFYLNIDEYSYRDKINQKRITYKQVFDSNDNTFNLVRFPYNFGIEIECLLTANAERAEYMDTLVKLPKVSLKKNNLIEFFVPSDDGSVHTSSDKLITAEIKSQILCGDKGWEKIVEFFAVAKPKFNSSCGMHVHISDPSKPFSKEEQIRLFVLGAIVDRLIHLLEYPKRYEIPYVRFAMQIDYVDSFMSIMKDSSRLMNHSMGYDIYDHYTSTNCTSFGTVEFRILPGTNDLNELLLMLNKYMLTVNIATNAGKYSSLMNTLVKLFETQNIKAVLSDTARAARAIRSKRKKDNNVLSLCSQETQDFIATLRTEINNHR